MDQRDERDGTSQFNGPGTLSALQCDDRAWCQQGGRAEGRQRAVEEGEDAPTSSDVATSCARLTSQLQVRLPRSSARRTRARPWAGSVIAGERVVETGEDGRAAGVIAAERASAARAITSSRVSFRSA